MKNLVLIALLLLPFADAVAQVTSAGQKEAVRIQRQIDSVSEEIRKTTTGGIAEELKNIPSKTKFSEEELRRIKEVQSSFGVGSQATITRDGWVVIPFGESPTLSCGINGFCVVALEPGELATKVKVSDQTVWEVDYGAYGPGSLIQTIILKPMVSDSYSQVLIFTNRGRVYNAFLVSKPVAYRKDRTVPIHSMKVRYLYPAKTSIDLQAIQDRQDAFFDERARSFVSNVKSAEAMEANDSTGVGNGIMGRKLKDYETNFEVRYAGGKKGDKNPSWKPVRVYADNTSDTTYIELPRGYDEIPTVFVKGRDGKNQVVTAVLSGENDNIIAIDGIHNRVVMKQFESGISKKYLTAFEAVRL